MHTALVQRLLQDRSAWVLAHRYEEPEVEAASAAHTMPSLLPSHA
jgi:quinolinate synthase